MTGCAVRATMLLSLTIDEGSMTKLIQRTGNFLARMPGLPVFVAIGMVVAAALSNKLGIFAEDELIRLQTVIQRADLPTKIPDLNIETIIKAAGYDKKIAQGRIRFVLPRTIGEVFITDEVSPSLLKQVLVSYNEET